ncbi:MAG TPA: DUF983 domain-containing protein [Opitutaceae bacterium]|nr:DUF983 domain-containing protein [Opitutaceae bacterium]
METKPQAFKVPRSEILSRGLGLRCPNCGEGKLFADQSYFAMAPACSHCQMRWDKDEGAFLGSVTLNYGVTVFGIVLPWIVIAVSQELSVSTIVAVAMVLAIGVPLLLYRWSKGAWFACYYLILPHHLPANWSQKPELDRPPDE